MMSEPLHVWRRVLALTLAVNSALASQAGAQPRVSSPDTVVVRSGALELRALLWRPAGRGPFAAVLFNHGSGRGNLTTPERTALGALFARHGYVFLFLHRRGAGLSAAQGANSFDVMRQAQADSGRPGRNRVQMRLLEEDDLGDATAGLAFLRALPEVDARRVAVVGHSFGGILSLLLAERDTNVRAAVVFGAAAASWESSPELQARLRAAVRRTSVPVFFVYAANDFSVAPGNVLTVEMRQAGRQHRLAMYPAFGRSADEGHALVFRGTSIWEGDVFAFLKDRMK